MNYWVMAGALAAPLIFGAASSKAQILLEIPAQQEKQLYAELLHIPVPPPGTDLPAKVGAEIPPEIALHALPDKVAYGAVRRYRYLMVNNRVLFVDPATRVVVRVLEP